MFQCRLSERVCFVWSSSFDAQLNTSVRCFTAWVCNYSAPVGVRSIVIDSSVCVCVSVCLSASISLEPLDRSARNFVCGSTVTVARSSSDGVALRYVFPVLWTTSRLAVYWAVRWYVDWTFNLLPLEALRYRGGVWYLWMPCFTYVTTV